MRAVSYSKNNHLNLLHRGAEFFPALIRAFDAAESEIYLETYIFALDTTGQQVKAALFRAAARGVSVHVMVDWLGSGRERCELLAAECLPVGVQFSSFNPWFRRGVVRTHRKIVVIDGRLAFLGGLNINDDMLSDDDSAAPLPLPRWDFAVSISGPLVQAIRAEVAAQWMRVNLKNLRTRWQNLRKSRVLRERQALAVAEAALVVRDNLRNRSTIQRALLHALGHAHHSAYFVTPYFAPGRKLRRALAMAAQRGVAVTLLIGVGQFRMQDAVAQSFYPRLLRAGVKLFEYDKTQLHGKVAVIDDEWATVGSSNFDGLSLFVNHEANIIVRDSDFAQALRDYIARGVADGRMVSAEEVAAYSWTRRAWNGFAYFLYKTVLQLITAGKYTK
jgi:cardiolipin synthase